MRYYNEFKAAYESMPDFFSSIDFAKKARANGVPAIITAQGHGRNFLLKHTSTKQITPKTWQKNSSEKNKEDRQYSFETFDEIISFLKSKGYKILKPVNEWVEL